MAKQPRQRPGKKFSGNHQRSWLWGFHAVTETLTAAQWPVLEVLVTQATYDRAASLLDSKAAQGMPIEIVSAERLQELSHAPDHQGILARLGPFPYRDWQWLEQSLSDQEAKAGADDSASQIVDTPLLVMCDRLQDSFNLGAILRCCASAKVRAVVVGEASQAEVTSHVARSSAGAINCLPLVKTEDLVTAAQRLKHRGLRLLAADSNASTSMWDAQLQHPAVLIIGSEARGVDERLLDICDQRVLIPMNSRVNSLNAAVAAGILLYEIRRQQRGS